MPPLQGRITGGKEATGYKHSYIVSLQSGKKVPIHFCGGTILNENWILTAGHCVKGLPEHGVFIIKAGKHHLNVIEDNEQTIPVETSYVHELYDGYVNVTLFIEETIFIQKQSLATWDLTT